MEKIKYGIIGAGTMAREHILNLSLIDEAEVVALSDPHKESLKQCQELLKKEVVCFENHQDLIKENFLKEPNLFDSVIQLTSTSY